ncbi:hypothetical protein L209DRAFT_757998 [Thermothelomyces heterothallicus CBS 203.75]
MQDIQSLRTLRTDKTMIGNSDGEAGNKAKLGCGYAHSRCRSPSRSTPDAAGAESLGRVPGYSRRYWLTCQSLLPHLDLACAPPKTLPQGLAAKHLVARIGRHRRRISTSLAQRLHQVACCSVTHRAENRPIIQVVVYHSTCLVVGDSSIPPSAARVSWRASVPPRNWMARFDRSLESKIGKRPFQRRAMVS